MSLMGKAIGLVNHIQKVVWISTKIGAKPTKKYQKMAE